MAKRYGARLPAVSSHSACLATRSLRLFVSVSVALALGSCAEFDSVDEHDSVGDVAGAEAELLGARSCRTGFEEHGVYETTLVYGIDEQIEDTFILAMDPERNTVEYRTGAFDFFRERYGMDFDPSVEGDQITTDGQGGQALVRAGKLDEGSTHQVYALDAQRIPQWRGRLPITNTAFFDDGYFVFLLSDYEAHGTYGGADGLRIRAGDVVVQGEYRMFDDRGRLLDTIAYFADTPATVNPFAGDEEASAGATFISITCRVESEIFGTGLTRGIGEQRPLPGGGEDVDFRYVMRFPSRVSDSNVARSRCDRLRPLGRRL